MNKVNKYANEKKLKKRNIRFIIKAKLFLI